MSQEQVGQGEPLMGMQINYKWIPVYSTEYAADSLNLNHHYVTQLCDRGTLIATKANGRWWVHEQRYKGNYVSGLPF